MEKDVGLSEGEDIKEQEKLQKEISYENGENREKPNCSYYIFESKADRNTALELVGKNRQSDGVFDFLKNWSVDNNNPAGIALEFSKTPQTQDTDVVDFFERNGLKISPKVYKVDQSGIHDVNVETDDSSHFPKPFKQVA